MPTYAEIVHGLEQMVRQGIKDEIYSADEIKEFHNLMTSFYMLQEYEEDM